MNKYKVKCIKRTTTKTTKTKHLYKTLSQKEYQQPIKVGTMDILYTYDKGKKV